MSRRAGKARRGVTEECCGKPSPKDIGSPAVARSSGEAGPPSLKLRRATFACIHERRLVRPARLEPARGEPKARRGVTDGVLWQATFRRKVGAPSTTRTCDLLVRSQTLYPAELWALEDGLAIVCAHRRSPKHAQTLTISHGFQSPGPGRRAAPLKGVVALRCIFTEEAMKGSDVTAGSTDPPLLSRRLELGQVAVGGLGVGLFSLLLDDDLDRAALVFVQHVVDRAGRARAADCRTSGASAAPSGPP